MNRFNLKTLLLLLPFFAFAWGCDNDDDELRDRRPGDVTVTDSMVLSHTDYTFGIEGGSFTLKVNSSVKYAISSHSPWLRVSGSEDTYKVAAGATDSYDVREAVVYVTSADKSLKDTLRVSQASLSGLFLSKEQREQTVAAVAGEVNVLLYFTDAGYAVNPLTNWIHYIGTKTLHEDTLRLSVDPNDTYEERTGRVAIASVDGVYKDTLTVIQREKQDLVVQTPVFENVDKDGTVLTVTYEENIGEPVEVVVPEKVAWISWVATKALTEGELYLKVEKNKLAASRTATVALKCGELSREVTVTQAAGALPFELITTTATAVSTGEVITVEYNCVAGANITAEIPTEITWISVESTDTPGEIRLKVEENVLAKKRNATVVITDGSVKEDFVITQEAWKDPLWENADYDTKIIDLGENKFLVNKSCDVTSLKNKITGASEGAELYLRSGGSFSISSISLPRGVSIIGEPDAEKMPVITFKEWWFTNNSTIGNIIFKNIEVKAPNSYVFSCGNSLSNTSTVNSLQFIDCHIHDVGSALFRSRWAKLKLNKLLIDGCVIYHTGYPDGTTQKDQALITNSGDGGPQGDFELMIINTTFNDCSNVRGDKNLISFGIETMSSLKVTIENNTFYNCAINMAILNLPAGLTAKSNVSFKKNIVVGSNTKVVNLNDGSPVSCVIEGNCVPHITNYNDSAPVSGDPGFASPADGDFTVTNTTVKAAGVGDPRWLE